MSGFPRLWAAAGVDGATLIEEIVQLGLERHQRLARLPRERDRRRPARRRRRILGPGLHTAYAAIKQHEVARLADHVTDIEWQLYGTL